MEKCYVRNCNERARWIIEPLFSHWSTGGLEYLSCTEHLDMTIDVVYAKHEITSVVVKEYIVIAEQNVLAEEQFPLEERVRVLEKRIELLKSHHDLHDGFFIRVTKRLVALEEQQGINKGQLAVHHDWLTDQSRGLRALEKQNEGSVVAAVPPREYLKPLT